MIVMVYGIGKQWNNPPWEHEDSHPAFEIILLITMLSWIALLEGCQISIVGLQGIDMEPYKHTHPRAYHCCQLVHKGPNVERFLVGRQFLLLFNGFLASRVSGSRSTHYHMGDWEWDEWAVQIFWSNSALLMVVIIAVQSRSASCPPSSSPATRCSAFSTCPATTTPSCSRASSWSRSASPTRPTC